MDGRGTVPYFPQWQKWFRTKWSAHQQTDNVADRPVREADRQQVRQAERLDSEADRPDRQ